MGVDLDSGDPRGDFSQFVTILLLKPFDCDPKPTLMIGFYVE